MSIMRKVLETVARFVPDGEPDPLIHGHGHVGKPISRIDGSVKVRGEATFTADFKIANLTHAALVYGTIARGRIARIDATQAEAAPGVIAIVTHENAPRMKRPSLLNVNNFAKGVGSSDLPIMQDDKVHYDGEAVAVVVAETLEQAEHAASLVRVEYETEEPRVSFDGLKGEAEVPSDILGEDSEVRKGDAEGALAEAAFKVDNFYSTPRHNHNAIEPHATIAIWDGDSSLVVYDTTQFVNGTKHQLARIFRLKPDNVRVISPFVGGAFGGKWSLWSNTVLCSAAAKIAQRPVKLVLSREGTFRIIGGRTSIGTARRPRSEPRGQVHRSHPYRHHRNHEARELSRTILAAAAASLRDRDKTDRPEGHQSRYCRQHLDARAGRGHGDLRARIGDRRTRASACKSIQSSCAGSTSPRRTRPRARNLPAATSSRPTGEARRSSAGPTVRPGLVRGMTGNG